jgi:error-prone DNA polymerase
MERRFAAIPMRSGHCRHRGALHLLASELSYQYPDEIVMSGRSPQEALERLTREALTANSRRRPRAYCKLLSMS